MTDFRINWDIVDKTETYNKRFNLRQYNSKVKIDYNVGNSEIEIENILIQLELALNGIIHRVLRGAQSDDHIRVPLRNQHLDYDIFVPFRRFQHFTTEALLNEIIKVSQSRRDFLLYGLIDVDIIHVRTNSIGGGGYRSKSNIIDLERWRTNSKKVIRIPNDGLCCARSIVVSKAYTDGIRGSEWRKIRSDVKKVQYKLAFDLCVKAQVTLPANGVKYEDFKKFQDVLSPEYQLIVTTPPKNFYFVGQQYSEKQLYVLLTENHCDSLLSIKAFLRFDYFCKRCLKGYVGRTNHQCSETCSKCFGTNKCIGGETSVFCNDCNRDFVSQSCFERHKNETKVCNQYKKCTYCEKLFKGKSHICGKKRCKTCKRMCTFGEHNCFITPKDKAKLLEQDQLERVFIFYDFESQQISQKLNEYIHKPNLCVVNIT